MPGRPEFPDPPAPVADMVIVIFSTLPVVCQTGFAHMHNGKDTGLLPPHDPRGTTA